MPRGPAPQWRARMQPVLDGHLLKSVDKAGGHGSHDPATGYYGTLYIRGLADRAEAEEWKRALYRSAKHLHRYRVADIGVSATIRRTGGTYEIEFVAVDKTIARKHVMEKYGPDPSKWPYNPHARNA